MTLFSPLYAPLRNPLYQPFSKRAGGFSPVNIADLNSWHDASDLATITGSPLVTQWDDKTENGNDLTPPVNGPTTGAATINGLNALEFDGVNDALRRAAYTADPNTTIFAIFRPITVDDGADTVLNYNASNDFQIDAGVATGEFFGRFSNANLGVTALDTGIDMTGSNSLLTTRLSSGDVEVTFRVNGTLTTTMAGYNGNLDTPTTLTLGANRGFNQFLHVAIGELLIYNRDLTPAEVAQVENYLTDKWAPGVFNPVDIPGIASWHDATVSSSIAVETGVSGWKDQSGNDQHFLSSLPAEQPTTGVETINGRNALGFDGIDDRMLIASYATDPNFTVFTVFRPRARSGTGNANESVYSFDAVTADFQMSRGGVVEEYRSVFIPSGLGMGAISTTVNTVNTDTLQTVRLSDTGGVPGIVNVRVNGVDEGSNNSYDGNFASPQLFRLGENRDGAQMLQMALGEIIVYNRDLTAAEIDEVEAYLTAKWQTIFPTHIPDLFARHNARDDDLITQATGVSSWADATGHGNDLVQASGTLQPTVGELTMNGFQTIGFDGIDDYLIDATFVAQSTFTIVMVIRPYYYDNESASSLAFNDTQDFQIESVGGVAGQGYTGSVRATAGLNIDSDFANAGSDVTYQNNVIIYRFSTTDATVEVYLDGVKVGESLTYDGGMSSPLEYILGTDRNKNASLKMAAAEFMIYNRDLNSTEIGELTQYARDRWNLSSPAFQPTQITGLNSWYDAGNADSITGLSVSQWADRSGNANHLTQAGGVSRPISGTDTINGVNAITFDGDNDWMSNATSTVTADMTMFIVVQAVATDNANDSVLNFDAVNGFQIDADISGQFRGAFKGFNLGSGTLNAGADMIGTPTLLTYRLSAGDATIELRRDGAAVGSTTYNGNLTASQTFTVGRNRGTGDYIEMHIGEIIFYDADLTADEIDQVELYLSEKWTL